jgi:hypothetical protein
LRIRIVRVFAGLLVSCLVSPVYSHSEWFTVVGDRNNPDVDTVDINPTFVFDKGDEQKTQMRVNRSGQKNNWEGIAYRSYESKVIFNCTKHEARYARIVFYLQPLWQGEASYTSVYKHGTPRLVEFPGMTPDPSERIIRAVCQKATVRNN